MPVPAGFETIAPTSSAVLPLTAATINNILARHGNGNIEAQIQCATYPVAYRYDGVDPTTSTVQQLAVGDSMKLGGTTALRNFRAIGVGGTAALAVSYWVEA